MTDGSEMNAQKPVSNQPFSWLDQFFLQWGPESLKATVPSLNDSLSKMVTLVSALIGGGFVAAKGDVLPYWWTIGAIGCLICSLSVALWGLCPTGRRVNLNSSSEIKAFEYGAIVRKEWCIKIAFVLLVAAFASVFIGLIFKGPPLTIESKPLEVKVFQP